jgi:hypothetical protein
LADRGWGKPASFEPLERDPLDLEDVEKAAEVFRAKIMCLADRTESARAFGSPPGRSILSDAG